MITTDRYIAIKEWVHKIIILDYLFIKQAFSTLLIISYSLYLILINHSWPLKSLWKINTIKMVNLKKQCCHIINYNQGYIDKNDFVISCMFISKMWLSTKN